MILFLNSILIEGFWLYDIVHKITYIFIIMTHINFVTLAILSA